MQSAYSEDLPVLIVSAGSPCISHTPFSQLLLVTAGWGRKKGIKSVLRSNIFPFLQAGSFRAADGYDVLPEHPWDQPLPDTDWGPLGLAESESSCWDHNWLQSLGMAGPGC